jgi:hypothetical protein
MTRDVSFEAWWDQPSMDDVVDVVGVGTEVRVEVRLRNRYKFCVHLERATLRAEFEGVSEGPPYEISEIVKKDIPELSSHSSLVFKIVPRAAGRFRVTTFAKNYWGYVDTELDCGPVVFDAKMAHPQLSMEIVGLPESAFAGQCQSFEVRLTNVGDGNLKGFALAFDGVKAIVSEDENCIKRASLTIVVCHEPAAPGQTVAIPLIFRAKKVGVSSYHFFAAVSGIKTVFGQKTVRVVPAADFEIIAAPVLRDSADCVYHCTVHSHVDDIEILGVIDRTNRFLRTEALDKRPLNKQETRSFVGFTAQYGEAFADEWRSAFMRKSPIAVLFKLPGISWPLQKNLRLQERNPEFRLKLDVPPQIEVTLGSKVPCTVSVIGTRPPGLVLYVQPMEIRFIQTVSDKKKTPDGIAGCRWVGITKGQLSAQTEFAANLSFRAYTSGIYEIPGLFVWKEGEAAARPVLLSQYVQIIPK